MYFHKAQEKPRIWGSFQDRQYSIWRNLEDIYRVDHKSEALIMPLFWGLPAQDYSRYGNHGINHGATYKDGSLDFDGDDYVEVGDKEALDLITSLTIASWVKIDNKAIVRTITSKGTGGQTDHAWDLKYHDTPDTFRASLRTSSAQTNADGTTSPTVGEWYFTVVTWDETNIRMYLNNDLESTTAFSGPIQTNICPVLIGSPANFYSYFSGIIDEVRISNIVYSADQIALFHDRQWDLYRPVSRPIYSLPTPPAAIIHFHKAQQKPQRWGNFQDVQYAIRKNFEKIYGCDPDDDVLVMPLFWGLPPMDYSGYNNHGTNHGATYKDGSLDFDGNDYINIPISEIIYPFSISCRARTNQLTVTDVTVSVADKDDTDYHAIGFGGSYLGDPCIAWTFNKDISYVAESTISYKPNILNSIDGVFAGASSRTVFLNGENSGTNTDTYTVSDLDRIRIGVTADSTPYGFFTGTIDEVRISKVARTADQIALFHDRLWDLYRPVSRPIYSLPTLPVAIMNQFQGVNLGADLFNGTLL